MPAMSDPAGRTFRLAVPRNRRLALHDGRLARMRRAQG
jgi:hypothetical protein